MFNEEGLATVQRDCFGDIDKVYTLKVLEFVRTTV